MEKILNCGCVVEETELGQNVVTTSIVTMCANHIAECEAATAASLLQEQQDAARNFLQVTDWLVIRHRDQIDADITTSMSSEDFTSLLLLRQTARDRVTSVQSYNIVDLTNQLG